VLVILRQNESPRELADAVRGPVAGTALTKVPRRRTERDDVLRTFGVGAQILQDLGVKRMRVLSAPRQLHGLGAFGLEIVEYLGEQD
jgi:3,4-dihydroxy 2-butanone 4-phosphate synthase/GTP cyclohydrolase II